MFEMPFTAAEAVLYVQFCGKSMQRGALAACISVKVTVDFCCAVPFLNGIATIVHVSFSLSISVSVLLSLTHLQSLLCWERHKYDSLYWVSSFALSLCPHSHVRLCVSGLHLPSLTARTLQQPSNKALQLPTQLLFGELYKNRLLLILCCSLTILCTVFTRQIINICNLRFCC